MSMLEKALAALSPRTVLDVGCGCGRVASSIQSYCRRIVAVDVSASLIPRWRDLGKSTTLRFCCMDGRTLAFRDKSFSLVLARDTLHHATDWTTLVDEIERTSSRHLIIEEPFDDLRSAEKRNTFEAQGLLLELQREVGYSHYRHLSIDALVSYVQKAASVTNVHIEKCDKIVSFDEFFFSFDWFAGQSARPSYWHDRLEGFRTSLGRGGLCEDDRVLLVASTGQNAKADSVE